MTDDRFPGEDQLAEVAVDAGAGTVVVRVGRLQRILSLDEALLVSVQRFRRPWRTALARTLTHLGDGKSWTAIGLACLATATERGAHLGLRIGAATGIATLLSQALKRSLTRARPDASITGFEALAANPDRFSFPSGHTAAAFGVAVAFAGEPASLGPAALLLAVGIGLSRVYLGAHYPLDVVAGAVLGVFGGLASRLLVS
ncbi:phosphatase PAP2 family protein [Anaeromyxobacter dehalogenans]|uniref:Phosphoesterase, PA-phosphatase related protein n=1 Tax=Anaeromyxobacter dehalogenans (strain 2CP-C) TaxID=290397 RepID=Q2IGQ8_ANADE|nr:phosphatase PAP2 family protein [Anaeromyxobacter dehalogenans]ABC83765.1 phosphoesterase, PA-phosphatase related protein [Anaeromyxobacter dehalogenans 2CP-C]